MGINSVPHDTTRTFRRGHKGKLSGTVIRNPLDNNIFPIVIVT